VSNAVGTSVRAGLLLAILGVVAWGTGEPFVFPSLGPTAFVLVFEGQSERTRARRVVGGHLVGAAAGAVAWTLVAGDAAMVPPPAAWSVAGLRLAGSAVVALVLTSGGMLATRTVHPPACATTLIVSLGLLSTPRQIAVVALGVVVLAGAGAALRRLARVGESNTSDASGGPAE